MAIHYSLTVVGRLSERTWLNLDLNNVIVADGSVRADCSLELCGFQLVGVVILLGEIRLIRGVHSLRLIVHLQACQLCLLRRVSRFTTHTQVRRN